MPKLKDLMIKRVATVAESSTVRRAAKAMLKRGVGCLVVAKDRRVLGVLTEGDVLKLVAEGGDPDRVTVRQAMGKPAVVGRPDDDLDRGIRVMVKHRIKRLPVVDDEKLVGIVTISNFARASAEFHQVLERELAKAGRRTRQKFQRYRPPPEPPAGMYA